VQGHRDVASVCQGLLMQKTESLDKFLGRSVGRGASKARGGTLLGSLFSAGVQVVSPRWCEGPLACHRARVGAHLGLDFITQMA